MIAVFLRKLFKLRENSEKPKAEADLSEEGLVKPFLDHLEDLRWVLVKSLLVLIVTTVLSFIFTEQILKFVQAPMAAVVPPNEAVVNTSPADPVLITFKLAFYAGLVFAFPVILFFVAGFILPALTRQEKRYILPGLGVAMGLFLLGISFCYYWVLPGTLRFFFQMSQEYGWKTMWTAGDYYSFVTQFMLVFGLAFELPVVVIVLVKLGLLTHDFMQRTRAYAVVLIFVLAAVITPTQDLLSLMALSAPMYVLYEACIWIALFIEKKENAASVPLPPSNPEP